MITASSVFVTVVFIVLLESVNLGMSNYLIDNEIRMYTAHVEVSGTDYSHQRHIGQAMIGVDTLIPRLQTLHGVTAVTRRLEMMVLAASDHETLPVIVWGMEPDPPHGFFDYATLTSLGAAAPNNLVLGNELANRLGIVPGDSAVLIGQSYQGRVAAGIYTVSGIAAIPIPDISKHMVFAPLDLVRDLAGIPQGATSLLVNTHDKYASETIKNDIERHLSDAPVEVRTWQEIMSGRLATYRLRESGVTVLKVILFVLLGFGILGAMMLTHFERAGEYRMLKALGLKPHYLATSLTIEMVLTSSAGLIAGLALTIPVVLLINQFPLHVTGELANIMSQFNVEPIIVLSAHPTIFINSFLLVFAINLIIAIITTFPVLQSKRTK
jgi:putative ABC transport system permease protein